MAIVDLIKYEGDNKTFIWKHPSKDFNMGTKLIVHESQEAVFLANGAVLDIFGPGEHYLESGNLPIVTKLFGNKQTFHCELYFANLTEQMAIRWGTDSKISYLDPVYKFPLEIGACGEMSLSVSDSTKLLVKLVGTEKELSQSMLITYFRSFLMNRIKSIFAAVVIEKNYSVFELDAHLGELSDAVKLVIKDDFSEYGICLQSFFITTIVKPDEDRNFIKFKELHYRQYNDVAEAELKRKIAIIEEETRAAQTVIEAEALAKKRATEGYSYRTEKEYEVAKEIARNDAIGQFTNVGMGLGMMTGVGGEVTKTVTGAAMQAMSQQKTICPNCNADVSEGMSFCGKCGTKMVTSAVCEGCGYVMPSEFGFCPRCGKKRG